MSAENDTVCIEVKLECLRLAIQLIKDGPAADASDVLEIAEEFYGFVSNGSEVRHALGLHTSATQSA